MDLQSIGRWAGGHLGRDSAVVKTLRPVYEWALFALSGGRGIRWTINGLEYRINPRRRNQFAPTHEAEVALYLREHVAPGAVCYDVGANIGIYVLQLARWTGPSGRIVAFEPNPVACRVLEEHVQLNGVGSQVRVVQAAVSDAPGRATLHASESDAMSRLDVPNPRIQQQARPVDVNVITLDDFSANGEQRPDWILIDTEGYELAVLRGARRLIRGGNGVPRIVVEMHPSEWASIGESHRTAAALFDELRLRPVPLSGQTDGLAEHGVVALEPY